MSTEADEKSYLLNLVKDLSTALEHMAKRYDGLSRGEFEVFPEWEPDEDTRAALQLAGEGLRFASKAAGAQR
jgi:hypothetical protein